MNILELAAMKLRGEKISMVTCYDYTSAKILNDTPIDCVLVGDSAAMTMHGHRDTITASIEMMCWHTQAVAKGITQKLIISDLPFLSYRQSLSKNIAHVQRLMQSGAHGLKLEGAQGNIKLIRHLVESGIPIIGHLGLTIQMLHSIGGFKVQGRNATDAERIKADALALQAAGCFAIVLECIPVKLAAEITAALSIPTIGIGAGNECDGQVLVFQDLMGLNLDFKPKFVKTYVNGAAQIHAGIAAFVDDIKTKRFPADENSYHA